MTRIEQEDHVLRLLDRHLLPARNPIVLCSFGKDSIVLLHLCLRIRKVPVLFFRFPKFHEKHAHALKVMRDWDLEVYDMWPSATVEYQHGTFFDVLHSYSTSPHAAIHLFSGIRQRTPDETRYLCAVDDLLSRPLMQHGEYPWDVTVHGHKGCDDPELGQHGRIRQPVSSLGATRVVTPFGDWADEDIWSYIHAHDLPYDRARYDHKQEASSPDKYPTCYTCLDTRFRLAQVHCPKLNRLIPSIAKSPAEHEQFRQSLLAQFHYCEVTGEPRSTPNIAHL